MTLAIAAEFPWGKWRQVVDSAPGQFRRAVILAADSRWSYEGRRPFNKGRKLWTLGRRVGFVLAGDVWCGEEGVQRLADRGRDVNFKHFDEIVNMAAKTFRETYDAHAQQAKKGQRPSCGRLLYLMAGMGSDGKTALVYFSSDGIFSPIYLSGIHGIGVSRAVENARDALVSQVGDPKNNPQLAPESLDWAMHVAGAINNAICDPGEDTVGGRVQLVTNDGDGWVEYEMSFLPAGCDFEMAENWEAGTYPLSSLATAKSTGLRKLASCENQDLLCVPLD